jgi:hypothetical protein
MISFTRFRPSYRQVFAEDFAILESDPTRKKRKAGDDTNNKYKIMAIIKYLNLPLEPITWPLLLNGD